MAEFSVSDLEAIVAERLSESGGGSYTRTLAAKGIEKCAEKFGEEAVETVIAAVTRDKAALTGEAADVVFHLTVLLAVSGLSWGDVLGELSRRTGQSGLDEKQSRLPTP
ncbi:MAG: phosphoribosyl-ATP diphosphatase [Pseudomonadota bacterium]